MLQKSSTLIGPMAIEHIYDWLTQVKQIYEHGMAQVAYHLCIVYLYEIIRKL